MGKIIERTAAVVALAYLLPMLGMLVFLMLDQALLLLR